MSHGGCYLLNDQIVVDISREGNGDTAPLIPLCHQLAEVLWFCRGYDICPPNDRYAEGMFWKKSFGEDIVDEVFRVIVPLLDLFENHATLAVCLFDRKQRIRQHIGKDINGGCDIPRKSPHVITGMLTVREGIHVTANRIHFICNLFWGWTLCGAFEHHVL